MLPARGRGGAAAAHQQAGGLQHARRRQPAPISLHSGGHASCNHRQLPLRCGPGTNQTGGALHVDRRHWESQSCAPGLHSGAERLSLRQPLQLTHISPSHHTAHQAPKTCHYSAPVPARACVKCTGSMARLSRHG